MNVMTLMLNIWKTKLLRSSLRLILIQPQVLKFIRNIYYEHLTGILFFKILKSFERWKIIQQSCNCYCARHLTEVWWWWISPLQVMIFYMLPMYILTTFHFLHQLNQVRILLNFWQKSFFPLTFESIQSSGFTTSFASLPKNLQKIGSVFCQLASVIQIDSKN